MFTQIRLVGLCIACLWGTVLNAQFTIPEMYEAHVYTNKLKEVLPYRMFHNPSPDKSPVPLLVLLHGSGECGTNNTSQLNSSVAAFHKTYLKTYHPICVIVPQCSAKSRWVRQLAFSPDYTMPRYAAPAMTCLRNLIDSYVKNGIADPNRLYIMGLSLGGFGVWDAVQRWPGYFAAAVPICGGGSIKKKDIENASKTPIWVFHGAKDGNVPVICSQRIVNALREIEAPIQYTEYPESGHVIWNTVYGDAKLQKWLFDQNLKKKPKRYRKPSLWNDFLDHFRPS